MGLLYLLRTVILAAVDLYVTVIIIYILMSWLPNKEYGTVGSIYRALGGICEPYLNLFRRFIPPLGMIDFSPVVAIIVLQVLARAIAMWL